MSRPTMDPLDRAKELRELGSEARRDGDVDRALALDLEAVTLFEQAGDPAWLSRACTSIGSDHGIMGATLAALEWDQRALEAADNSDDVMLQIMARNNLALDLCDLSRPDDALTYFRDAVRLSTGWGRTPLIFRAHHNLGYALSQMGRWDDAVAEFETAADQQRNEPGEPGELGTTLMELAGCYVEQGRRDDAINVLEEACTEFRLSGDTRSAEGCQARLAELRDA